MKKILFLLLSTIAVYGQVPADATPLENIQITNNVQDNTATKVTVQTSTGVQNWLPMVNLPVSTATQNAIDAKVGDFINDGATTIAPSMNAVYDALSLKQLVFTGIDQTQFLTENDIVFDNTALTLTIATVKNGTAISSGNPVVFYTDGNGVAVKHTKTTPVVFTFTNTTGVWYFYFDTSGNPIASQTAPSESSTIARVYRIYWNSALAVADKRVIESLEVYKNDATWVDRDWKDTQGAQYSSGFNISSNVLASGTPAIDGSNAVVNLTSGTIIDANLAYTLTNAATGTTKFTQNLGSGLLPATSGKFITITNNASLILDKIPATDFPFLWNATTNTPEYLTQLGVRTGVSANNFFVYYLYAIQDPRRGETIKIKSAEVDFANSSLAEAHTWTQLQTLFPTLRDSKIRVLYKLTFEYKTAFDVGTKKTALRKIEDLRKQRTTSTATVGGIIPASTVSFTAAGNISSNNVQLALEELDAEKASTLQGAYNNGSQIATALGAVTIKRGSAADTDNVLVVQNGVGTNTFSVKGNGDINGGTYNGYVPETPAIKSNESLTGAKRKGDVLYGIIDQYTGEEITLSKVTGAPTVDGVVYFQLASEYFKRDSEVYNVKWFGAKGDGINDDTSKINAAFSVYKNIYIPKGTWLVDYVDVFSDSKVKTDGFTTVIKQKPQSLADKRIFNIKGSNIIIGDLSFTGNISTDINEQNHAIFINSTAATGSMSNISIGDVHASNIRGDAVYIGHTSGYLTSNINIGNVVVDNVYRNGLSIVSANNINIKSVTGDKVGYAIMDVEADAGTGVCTNIKVDYVRGRFFGLVSPTAGDYIDKIYVGSLDLDPSYNMQSTPSYALGISTEDAVLLRNVKSATIEHAKINGYNRSGIFTITGVGELGAENIKIGSLQISNCSITDVVYNSYLNLPNTYFEIDYLDINIPVSGKRGISSLSKGVFNSIKANLWTDAILFYTCDNLQINNTYQTGTGYFSAALTKSMVKNSTLACSGLAVFADKLSFENVTATASLTLFTSGYADHNIINSTLNGTYYPMQANKFVKFGGTSSERLMADGSVESTVYAPLSSPALTGTPTAPTATAGTNTTQIATTAFVQANKNKLVGYTVATLPAGTIGDMAYVTDASGFSYNSILVGGGSGVTIAFFDGTNWRAH